MFTSEPVPRGPAQDVDPAADNLRVTTRLSIDYLLRSLQLVQSYTGLDYLTCLLLLAIISANTAGFDQNLERQARYAHQGDLPPTEARRPVSILSLSNAFGLPYETTRRHVNQLVKAGIASKMRKGIVIAESPELSGSLAELRRSNFANLQRLLRNLRKAGVTI
ncbi:MAG: hypothetical protein JSR86_06100 [Proteobacteria bacterium]|nr:hypothetical protein [Pseudomonadota bacterium]